MKEGVASLSGGLREAYRDHRDRLWGVCYRMLGVGLDADEVVQETFVRALSARPDPGRSLWPWLVRVATNLARDRLRERRRRPYAGPWLPSVVATDGAPGWLRSVAPDPDPEAAVTLRSDVDYAWLVALERLTPNQRAVLVLRQVLDLSSAETAEALGLTEGNVRILLHRARRALADAPEAPRSADPTVLAEFVRALQLGDPEAMVAVLAPDARAATDGGGEFHAARRVVRGADAVARLFVGLAKKALRARTTVELREVNRRPALGLQQDGMPRGFARRSVVIFDVEGRHIARTWSVLASAKLS